MELNFQITYWLIGITVLISWAAFSKPELINRFAMDPYRMHLVNGEYYRFIVSGFLHGGFSHLLWNMFSFYFFGLVVEQYFGLIFGSLGPVFYVFFYLSAIVVSDIPTYFKKKNSPGYRSIGASGGVAAVIFASIIFQPLSDICLYGILCFPGFILGTFYLIYSYFKGKNSNDGINHEAHLYGALYGLVFCGITYPRSLINFVSQLTEWKLF